MTETDDGLWSAKGEVISKAKPKSCNFRVLWDGDGLSEILDKNLITKWDWRTSTEKTLLTAEGCAARTRDKYSGLPPKKSSSVRMERAAAPFSR